MNPYVSHPRTPSRCAHAQRGLTLVEMMVAMVIGLVMALGAGIFAVNMGRQFLTTGSNTTADVNALVALSLIDDAGRSAGAGLYNNGKPLCLRLNAWHDGTVVSDGGAFLPARITDGGSDGASDTIVFTSGGAQGSLSSMPVLAPMAAATDSIVVSGGGLISNGDYALVGVPGTTVPCTLTQLTGAPTTNSTAAECGTNASSCQSLPRASGAAGVNPSSPSVFTTPTLYGFADAGSVKGPAVVTRLGSEFRQTAFSVLCNSLVMYNAFTDTPACTSAVAFGVGTNAVASDVVLVHAQYGVSASEADDVVASWKDASGTWATPSSSDVGRIKAIRVVLVTRSRQPEPTEVSTACTNSGGVANTGPCGFDDADAPEIDLSGLAVPSGKNWRHYRYRTYQAVIPLRSVIWSL